METLSKPSSDVVTLNVLPPYEEMCELDTEAPSDKLEEIITLISASFQGPIPDPGDGNLGTRLAGPLNTFAAIEALAKCKLSQHAGFCCSLPGSSLQIVYSLVEFLVLLFQFSQLLSVS